MQTSNHGKRSLCRKTRGKGKSKAKKKTFSREVLLLRRPSDGLVRGAVKAELQHLGHVLSLIDKEWCADEVLKKLEEAFKIPFEEIYVGARENSK